MRLDDFTTVLSDHQRTTFKDVIETSQFGRISQIHLVDEEDMTFTHGNCQRSIHELHDRGFTGVSCNQRVMSDQVAQLHPPMGSDLLYRPIQTTRDFSDPRGFT
ncbi:hypothetical protein D3C72_1552560 [compost metagenome]